MPSTLTLDSLSRALISDGTVTEDMLASLLGGYRHGDDDAPLQDALLARGVLGEPALATVLSALTGFPTNLGDRGTTTLPRAVAERTRTIVLDTNPPVLATATTREPLILEALHALGHTPAVVLIPAPHFTRLFRDAYLTTDDSVPAARDLYEVLDTTVARDGSDVHLTAGRRPAVRVLGNVEFLNYRPVSPEWMLEQIARLATPEKLAEYARHNTTDFAYSFGDRRFRVNLGRDRQGPTLVARLLPKDIPDVAVLGLTNTILNFTHLERGLVLVTGPTGSGKSTTLAALLSDIAHTRACHITTFEDPIEYLLPCDGLALITQRELGPNIESYATALRSALRQDPDVILIGEMRDQETVRAALEAAETGHLVFGTLHTMSAPQTIDRIISTFPANEQDHVRGVLGTVLKGVVSQTLLPTTDGKRRVAAFEVLVGTPAVSNLIRSGKDLRQLIQQGAKDGMQHMEAALAALAASGKVTLAEATFRAADQDEFTRQLAAAKPSSSRR